MNVAQLYYDIDSSEAKKATSELDKMDKSAAKAEKGQEKLANTSKRTGKAQATANDNVKRSVDRLRDSKGRYIAKARGAGKATSAFSGLLAKARFGLVGLAAAMVAVPFTLFTAGVARGTRDALTFNKALTEVATLTKDAKANTELLTRESIRLSDTYGGSSLSQVQAFYQAISAGAGSVREASVLLEDANKLAKAGVTEVATGVDVLTTAINAYGKEVLSTKDASDAIFVGVQQGKTTVAELASGLGNVIPIASSLGVEFDELVAAIASLTTQGQTTSLAITGVRAILATIAKPSAEAAKLAKQLGIEFNTTALKTKGLNQFLQDAVAKTNGSKEALAKLFGSVEALNAVLAFSGGAGEKFNQVQDEMARKSGATDEALKTVTESLSGRYDKAVAQIANSFQQLGEIILPAVVVAMELLSSGMQKVTAFIVDNVDKIKLEFQFLSDVTSAMFENIPSAIAVGIIGAMDLMVNSVKKGLNLLMNPINRVIGLINQVSDKNIDELKFDTKGTNFQGTLDQLGGDSGVGVAAYEEAIRKRQAGYQIIENRRKDFGASSDDGYVDAPVKMVTQAANDNAKAFEQVTSSAGKAGEAISKVANDNIDPYAKLNEKVKETDSAISYAREVAGGFMSDLRSGLKNGESFWDSFKNAALSALDKITDKLLNEVLDALFQVNQAGSGSGGGGIGGIIGGLFGGFGGGGGGVSAGFSAASSFMPSALFADGGYTGNLGTSQPAGIVHGQEFVNNAVSTRRFRPELEAMNRGINPFNARPANNNAVTQSNNYAPVYNIDARGAESGVEDKIISAIKQYDQTQARDTAWEAVNSKIHSGDSLAHG